MLQKLFIERLFKLRKYIFEEEDLKEGHIKLNNATIAIMYLFV